jgi:predicted PurR-regulated permease PerM
MKLLPLLPSPSGSPYHVAEAGYQCVSNAEANKQLNNSNETQRLKDRAESSIVCACVGSAPPLAQLSFQTAQSPRTNSWRNDFADTFVVVFFLFFFFSFFFFLDVSTVVSWFVGVRQTSRQRTFLIIVYHS